MPLFDPILVGHDGSEEARRAFGWAGELASALDSSVVAAHGYSVGDVAGGPDSAAAAGKTALEGWIGDTRPGGLTTDRISTVVVSGPPGQALVEMAEINRAGLLVLGAHHRPTVAKVLGRVAQHVTFRSPCPVTIVRDGGGPVSSAPLIVGFDPDNPNDTVISLAFDLASGLGVGVEIVTVGADVPATADDEVFRLSERVDLPVINLHSPSGEPGPQLLDRATELDASVIVIGQKRKRSLGGRLLGGTAAWLLHNSNRPVMLVGH